MAQSPFSFGTGLGGASTSDEAGASSFFAAPTAEGLGKANTSFASSLNADQPWSYATGVNSVKEEYVRASARLRAVGVDPSSVDTSPQSQEPWWMGGLKTLSDLGVALDWMMGDAVVRTTLGGGLVQGATIDKYAEDLGTHAPTGKELLLKWGMFDQEGDRKGQIDVIDVAGFLVEVGLSPTTWFSMGAKPLTEALLKGGSKALRATAGELLLDTGKKMALSFGKESAAEVSEEVLKASGRVGADVVTEVAEHIHTLGLEDLVDEFGDVSVQNVAKKMKAADRLRQLGLVDDAMGQTLDVAKTGMFATSEDELLQLMGYTAKELTENPNLRTQALAEAKDAGYVIEKALEGNKAFRELRLLTMDRLKDPGGLKFGLQGIPGLQNSGLSVSVLSQRKVNELMALTGADKAVDIFHRSKPFRAMAGAFISDWKLKEMAREDSVLGQSLLAIKRSAQHRLDSDLHAGIETIVELYGQLGDKQGRKELLTFLEAPSQLSVRLKTIIDETPLNALRDFRAFTRALPSQVDDGTGAMVELTSLPREQQSVHILSALRSHVGGGAAPPETELVLRVAESLAPDAQAGLLTGFVEAMKDGASPALADDFDRTIGNLTKRANAAVRKEAMRRVAADESIPEYTMEMFEAGDRSPLKKTPISVWSTTPRGDESVWYRVGGADEYTEFTSTGQMSGGRGSGFATGQYAFASESVAAKQSTAPGGKVTSLLDGSVQEVAPNVVPVTRVARPTNPLVISQVPTGARKGSNPAYVVFDASRDLLRAAEGKEDLTRPALEALTDRLEDALGLSIQVDHVAETIDLWRAGADVHPLNILLGDRGYDGIEWAGDMARYADDGTFGNVRFAPVDHNYRVTQGTSWQGSRLIEAPVSAPNPLHTAYQTQRERIGDVLDYYMTPEVMGEDGAKGLLAVQDILRSHMALTQFRMKGLGIQVGALDDITPRQLLDVARRTRGAMAQGMDAAVQADVALNLAYHIADMSGEKAKFADEMVTAAGKKVATSQDVAERAQVAERVWVSISDEIANSVMEFIDILKAPTRGGEDAFRQEMKSAIAFQNKVLNYRAATHAANETGGNVVELLAKAVESTDDAIAPHLPAFAWNSRAWIPSHRDLLAAGITDVDTLNYAARRVAQYDTARLSMDENTLEVVRRGIDDLNTTSLTNASDNAITMTDHIAHVGDSAYQRPMYVAVPQHSLVPDMGLFFAKKGDDAARSLGGIPYLTVFDSPSGAMRSTGASEVVMVSVRARKPLILDAMPANQNAAVVRIAESAEPVRLADVPDYGYDAIEFVGDDRVYMLPGADSFHRLNGSANMVTPPAGATNTPSSARPLFYLVDRSGSLQRGSVAGAEAEALRKLKPGGKAFQERVLDAAGAKGGKVLNWHDADGFVAGVRRMESIEYIDMDEAVKSALRGSDVEESVAGMVGEAMAASSAEEMRAVYRAGGLTQRFFEDLTEARAIYYKAQGTSRGSDRLEPIVRGQVENLMGRQKPQAFGPMQFGRLRDYIADPVLYEMLPDSVLDTPVEFGRYGSKYRAIDPAKSGANAAAYTAYTDGWASDLSEASQEVQAAYALLLHPKGRTKVEIVEAMDAITHAMSSGELVGRTSDEPARIWVNITSGRASEATRGDAASILDSLYHEIGHVTDAAVTGTDPSALHPETVWAASGLPRADFIDIYKAAPDEVRAQAAGRQGQADELAGAHAAQVFNALEGKREQVADLLDRAVLTQKLDAEYATITRLAREGRQGSAVERAAKALYAGESPAVATATLSEADALKALELSERVSEGARIAGLKSSSGFKDPLEAIDDSVLNFQQATREARDMTNKAYLGDFEIRRLEMPYWDFVPRKMLVNGVEQEVPEEARRVAVRTMGLLDYYGQRLSERGLAAKDLLEEYMTRHAENVVDLPGQGRTVVGPTAAFSNPIEGGRDAINAWNKALSNPSEWSRLASEQGWSGERVAALNSAMQDYAAKAKGLVDLPQEQRTLQLRQFVVSRLGVDPSLADEIDTFALNYEPQAYFPHVLAGDDAKGWLARIFGLVEQRDDIRQVGPARPMSTKMPNVDKARELKGTIAAINDVMGREFFYSDPAKALSIYIQRATKAINTYDFLTDLRLLKDSADNFAVRPALFANGEWVAPEGYKVFSIKEMKESKKVVDIEQLLRQYPDSAGALEGMKQTGDVRFMARAEIVDEVEQATRAFFSDENMADFAGLYDRVLGIWKTYATVARPGFHIRNLASNLWQNMLAGVTNPDLYFRAATIQKHGEAVEKAIITHFADTGVMLTAEEMFDKLGLAGAKVRVGGGAEVSEASLWALMKDKGIIGSGRIGSDIHIFTEQELARLNIARGAANPFSQAFLPIRKSREFGTQVENNARIAHFLDVYGKGGDADAAAWSVRKYLFDYNELTPMERNVFRRAWPFYSWMRKNAALQAEMLAKRPMATVTAIRGQRFLTENSGIEDQPQYAQEIGAFGLPGVTVGSLNKVLNTVSGGLLGLDEAQDTPLMLNVGLPYNDLLQLNAKDLFSALSPAIKVPVETVANYQVYFGKPIWNYPGELQKAPSDLQFVNQTVQKVASGEQKLAWARLMDAIGAGVVEDPETGEATLKTAPWFAYAWQTVSPHMRAYGKALETNDEKQAASIIALLSGLRFIPVNAKQEEFFSRRGEAIALQNKIKALESQGVSVPTWGQTPDYLTNQAAEKMVSKANAVRKKAAKKAKSDAGF